MSFLLHKKYCIFPAEQFSCSISYLRKIEGPEICFHFALSMSLIDSWCCKFLKTIWALIIIAAMKVKDANSLEGKL